MEVLFAVDVEVLGVMLAGVAVKVAVGEELVVDVLASDADPNGRDAELTEVVCVWFATVVVLEPMLAM